MRFTSSVRTVEGMGTHQAGLSSMAREVKRSEVPKLPTYRLKQNYRIFRDVKYHQALDRGTSWGVGTPEARSHATNCKTNGVSGSGRDLDRPLETQTQSETACQKLRNQELP